VKLILDLAEKVFDNIAIKIGNATGGWKRGRNSYLVSTAKLAMQPHRRRSRICSAPRSFTRYPQKERHDQENGREAVEVKVEAYQPLLFLHARIEQSLRPIVPILEKAIEIS
jgi:hypothetical protein